MTDELAAVDVFSVVVVRPPRWRFLTSVVLSLVSQSSLGVGGGRAVVKRRSSERVVGKFVESSAGSSASELAAVLADYETMTAADFERTWLSK